MYCGSPAHGGVIVHNQGCFVLSQTQRLPRADKEHDREVVELLKRIVASLDALVERGNE